MPSALNQARGDGQPDGAGTPVKICTPAITPGAPHLTADRCQLKMTLINLALRAARHQGGAARLRAGNFFCHCLLPETSL
jgi:hypothetical protein